MVWEISVEKQLNSEYWLNVYHADVATQAEAQSVGNEIVAVERAVHMNIVGFTKYRVRQVSELAGPGTVYPVGLQGLLLPDPYLPLFVVARIDIAVAVGRPDRKYIKMPSRGALINNGNWTGPALQLYNEQYCQPLLGIEGLSDRSGQPYQGAACNPAVGMRQLRRGTRKRTTPILP